ncbi:MAG: RNA polymerase sigma factor, partial [Planctomycetota bacterium]
MTPSGGAPTPEALLEHAGFLRGLARSLLYDPGQAEDVVQETLLVALERSPRHRSRMRAWLAGIARNIALKSLRSERRRSARERQAQRPERVTPPDRIASRLEMQRRLVDAVEALEEPYRSTVVHRFFDDRKPAEIARLAGVPRKTVETRLRRAIEHLRATLDADFGGHRRSWCLALIPLVHLSVPAKAAAASVGGAAAITGVLAMSKKAVVIVISIVLVGAFVAGWGYRAISEGPAESGERVAKRGNGTHVSADVPEQPSQPESPAAGATEESPKPTGVVEEASTPKEGTVDAVDPKAPRYLFPGMERSLTALDWELISESLSHLPPLLDVLVTAVMNGEELPPSVGDIQRWNGPLVG